MTPAEAALDRAVSVLGTVVFIIMLIGGML